LEVISEVFIVVDIEVGILHRVMSNVFDKDCSIYPLVFSGVIEVVSSVIEAVG